MEEDEVAGLEVVPGDPSAFVVLETGVVPELDPELTVDVHRQARAVEPGRRRAAPNVGDAEELVGKRDGLTAERVHRDVRQRYVATDEQGHASERGLGGRHLREPEHDGGAVGRLRGMCSAREADEELSAGRKTERRVRDERPQRDQT